MDTTFLILPQCSQASSKSNCTQPHLPFSSLIYPLSGYRHLFALLPHLADYPVFTKSFLSSPSLPTISSVCCYFLSLQGSLLLSELYQFIYIFKLMEGNLVLTHTLYSGGTRGQESGGLGRGDPEEWM